MSRQDSTTLLHGEVAVQIPLEGASLLGDLFVPPDAHGIVLFAHGSGSGRRSPRNREVAAFLHQRGLATLLVDLLTPHEAARDERTGEHRFDIDLLAARVGAAARWLSLDGRTSRLAPGFYGASTGAAAALVAAAAAPGLVRAVVSRGGRADLAGEALTEVTAPTLLIVGGEDAVVLELNREALRSLRCPKRLEVVAGATHLFEEPGAMNVVAALTRDWFERYLGA